MNLARRITILPACAAAFLFTLASCESTRPPAEIMEKDEEDMVDIDKAGAAAFRRLVDPTVEKLLEPYKGEFAEIKVRSLAFVDLENRTSDELGSTREDLIEAIEGSVNDRRDFKAISIRFVSAILKEMGNPPVDKLFTPKGRREFAKVMEAKSVPVQYLMFGKLTSMETKGAAADQVNYRLTLELVNIQSGEQNKKNTVVRKRFN